MARWKCVSGKHYMKRNGQMVVIAAGAVVEAEDYELGGAKDKFERLDPVPPEETQPQKPPAEGLVMKHKGSGKWDVINSATGEKINDKLLTREEAETLIG